MEIINIEARTFEAMAERFRQFAQRVNSLCRPQNKGLRKWLDYQLGGGKILYRESDIEKMLNDNYFPSFE